MREKAFPIKKVELGGYTYDVKVEDGAGLCKLLGKQAGTGEEFYGAYSPDDQTILIRKGLTPQMSQQTLLHEVVHAIMYNNNIGRIENDDKNEDLVDKMAWGFMEVCKRNPTLINWVMKTK